MNTARNIALGLLLTTAVGCAAVTGPGDITPDSLLQAATASPDAVTLDIYWARAAADDEEVNNTLWQSVQEDRIPVETRNALAEYGLRAGVVGGTPPNAIVRLLNPTGAPIDDAEETLIDESIIKPKQVTRNLRQLRPGQRGEIQVTDAARAMTLLFRKGRELTGDTFPDASGLYALEVVAIERERVDLQLTPELHHGQPRMQYTSSPGIVVQRIARDVEVYANLRTRVSLTPGEMLVVACLPDAGHRLGGQFHLTESDSGPQQKILLVRLSNTPDTEVLAQGADSVWPWR